MLVKNLAIGVKIETEDIRKRTKQFFENNKTEG